MDDQILRDTLEALARQEISPNTKSLDEKQKELHSVLAQQPDLVQLLPPHELRQIYRRLFPRQSLLPDPPKFVSQSRYPKIDVWMLQMRIKLAIDFYDPAYPDAISDYYPPSPQLEHPGHFDGTSTEQYPHWRKSVEDKLRVDLPNAPQGIAFWYIFMLLTRNAAEKTAPWVDSYSKQFAKGHDVALELEDEALEILWNFLDHCYDPSWCTL